MKKLSVFLCAVACMAVTSCNFNNDNIDIAYKDTGQYYSMNAYFGKSKIRTVEYYLDKQIGEKNNMSFVNVQADAMLTLDDKTKFYIKKSPGHVEIKLNKDENSPAAYYRMKSICEGMKKVLTN